QGRVGLLLRARTEFFVIDGKYERGGTALLLRERRQVAVAGDAQHFHAFVFERLGKRADSQATGVLRAVIFIDDDDRKAKLHVYLPAGNTGAEGRWADIAR